MSKSIFAVFGATGNQGNSTANFVLDDAQLSARYSVRAISRDISNPKAQALKAKGAELVQADLDDPASLPAALKGVSTVFFLTATQYDGNTRAAETQQAKAFCDAALQQGVEYIIFSSMSHPFKISNGALKHVDHFDVKAEIETQIRGLPIKSAFFAPGSFMQNFQSHFYCPRPSPANDGSYVLIDILNAQSRLPFIDISDTGKWVGAILAEPDKYEGKFFAAAEGLYTPDEACAILEKVTGKKVVHQQVPDEVFKGFLPEPMREQLYEMWVLQREYGYYGEGMEEKVRWAREQARGEVTGLEAFFRKVGYTLE